MTKPQAMQEESWVHGNRDWDEANRLIEQAEQERMALRDIVDPTGERYYEGMTRYYATMMRAFRIKGQTIGREVR